MIKINELPALLVGLMATFVGIGLARFAYTPLIPEMAEQGWFESNQLAYLGAANLLGYFIGALSAHWLSERFEMKWLLRACFISIFASFVLCSQPVSFDWFFLWRFLAGVTGAILMVLAPSAVMSFVPRDRQAGVTTLVFTGIGIGAVMSALIIPLFLKISLGVTWLALAGLTVLAALVSEYCTHRLKSSASSKTESPNSSAPEVVGKGVLLLLIIAAYALDALGFVPHTVFWVDYLAREQGLGVMVASFQWAVFGVGAVCGPLMTRYAIRYIGCHRGLLLGFLLKAVAIGIPLFSVDFFSRTLSSFLVGALVPGLVALTSARISELVGPHHHKRFWGLATAVFALAQAVSGYGMAALYEYWGGYHHLFLLGCSSLLIGAGCIAFSGYYRTDESHYSK